MTTPTFPGFFPDFLNEVPESAFFSRIGQFSDSPRRQNFFQNQFPNVENQFIGAIGSQFRTGQAPSLKFDDFLNDFDFDRLFRDQSRFQRGRTSNLFNPSTRFLFQGV